MSKSNVDRRDFLKATTAGATALSLTAASASRVYGANEKLRVGFLGVGGRCQQHVDVILQMRDQGKAVVPVAACDVWDGDQELGRGKGRGLYPTAKRCGLDINDKNHVSKDYHRILDQKDVDIVVVATPDHWHAKICMDAAGAGKDIYCEKPMTRTIAEAHAVVDAVRKANRVMTVGVQSMADPTWHEALKYIQEGKIGKVLQGQTSYYRNSDVGQWRYYPLKKGMTPKTIDWNMWLGHNVEGVGEKVGPKIPFNREVWAQWRCYWPFGGGMFTDLFVHQTTHLISAMGVRYPRRVVGAGGIYLEYDDRDVPDVATVVADYDEGCQAIITATMCNNFPIDECIRGHLATIKFRPNKGFEVIPQVVGNKPQGPAANLPKGGKFIETPLKGSDTYALWENFLSCVRDRQIATLSTPELGAAAFTTVNMGVLSYRQGKALFWDKEQRKAVPADESWASKWEQRSKKRGKASHIIGWKGGDTGSKLNPPEYMDLAGPWTGGQDPAQKKTSSRKEK
jgi:predicted dehydrogenase